MHHVQIPWVQYTLTTAIHLVLHTPCTSFIAKPTVSCFLPVFPSPSRPYCTHSLIEQIWDNQENTVSAPVAPPFQTNSSRFSSFKYCPILTWSRPPSASANSLDYELGVHLNGHLISASKCIFNLPWSDTPSASLNSLHMGCSASLNSLYHSLQVNLQLAWTYLQVRTTTASKCISKTHSMTCLEWISNFYSIIWCGETLELQCREPIFNTPPHLAWHPNAIWVTVRYRSRSVVRRWLNIAGYEAWWTTKIARMNGVLQEPWDEELGKTDVYFV